MIPLLMDRYRSSFVTALDILLVPLTFFHGMRLIEVAIKIFPGHSGAVLFTNAIFYGFVAKW